MNKMEYLNKLEKELRAAHVTDYSDILEEYNEHFDMKIADGYSEEEIAARLTKPEEIAVQYKGIEAGGNVANGVGRIVLTAGVVVSDMFAGIFLIMMYAWVVVAGAAAVAFAALGVCLTTGQNIWSIIPQMPYFCALILGLSFVALSVLSTIGTIYCNLYVTQLLRVYINWRKEIMGKGGHISGGHISPPIPKHPVIDAKKRRNMRNTALFSLAVFGLSFVLGFVLMAISAGAFEFWHVWQWFM